MLNQIQCTAAEFNAAAYNDADSIVLFLCKECAAAIDKLELPEAAAKAAIAYTAQHDDIYDAGSVTTLVLPQGEGLLTLLLAGCGEGKDCKPNNFRKAAGATARALHKAKAQKAVLAAPILLNAERSKNLQALVEGLYLGAYTFNRFKSEAKQAPLCEAAVLSAVPEAAAIITAAEISAEAVCYARDLVNNPGNVVTPQTMAEDALKLGQELPLEITIMDETLMEARGMHALLAVGQGSHNPPCLVALRYNGNGDAPYTAFVGKGITFDSGGISIKPDDNMGEMKDDMTGAGAVLGAMRAIARLGLKCNVIGVLACAENMPDGKAQRPGDIVRAANGKTIEVVSTDAEGRMAGENYWQLPSLPECKEAIKSDVADLLNSAGRAGGCITGGLFIGEFVDKDIPWAHLDIGGTSTATKTEGFKVKGGTAFGTMTLIKLAGML